MGNLPFEKRLHPRHSFIVQLEIRLQGALSWIAAMAFDVSVGGFGLVTAIPIAEGERVSVRLRDGHESSVTTVVVRRCSRRARGYVVGAERFVLRRGDG